MLPIKPGRDVQKHGRRTAVSWRYDGRARSGRSPNCTGQQLLQGRRLNARQKAGSAELIAPLPGSAPPVQPSKTNLPGFATMKWWSSGVPHLSSQPELAAGSSRPACRRLLPPVFAANQAASVLGALSIGDYAQLTTCSCGI